MEIVENVEAVKNFLLNNSGKTIGFVPTMGYLHQGHINLMRRAKKENDLCVISIFVNPMQFNDKNDFLKYPKDLQHDFELVKKEGVDLIFTPTSEIMYPEGFDSIIQVKKLTASLEGASRPGHFDGVTTIVGKLFNIVQPKKAYFGQKDAQQVLVIEKMVRDLNFPVEIVRCSTVREKNGLAMSSRNARLTTEQREKANILYKSLELAKMLIEKGEKNPDTIIKDMQKLILSEPLTQIDYVSINESKTLKTAQNPIKDEILISLAVFFDKVRLIDNIILTVPK